MNSLPIHDIIPELKQKLIENNIVILQAPPGAGKSTALPLELLHEPWLGQKKIIMLEPRRLAARTVAHRMAQLINEQIGITVGYRIRFENKTCKQTKLEVVTEGILTRMLQQDNALEGVGLVIFDEFHERSLHADLALALCRQSQQLLREDLKILIMSATLDGETLSAVLNNAPIITSIGRQHPITIEYFEQDINLPISNQVAGGIVKALKIHSGDILAFLPGSGEIQRTIELLEQKAKTSNIKFIPLYGDLPLNKQQEAIMPDPLGKRKVVLATSIAETSLTIEGIKVVVDCGYSRVQKFNPSTGLSRLETIRVTKDTAEQRAGRAGRLEPGICYRLWNSASHHNFVANRKPEIMEADLSMLVLELAEWGIRDTNSIDWITPPPKASVYQAIELLTRLGAIENNKITKQGKEMLRMPTHPRISHLLVEGKKNNLSALASDLAAILEERDPLSKAAGANICLRVDALRKWRNKEFVSANKNILERIEKTAAIWRKVLNISLDNEIPVEHVIGKLIAAAYPERIAKQREQSHRFRIANGRFAKLSDQDPLGFEKWLSIAHLDSGTNEGKIFFAAPLLIDDIIEQASEKRTIEWNSQKGILIAQNEIRIGDLIVDSSPISNIPEEEFNKVILDTVRNEWPNILPWNEDTEDWLARLNCLKVWRTDEKWPDVKKNYLLETIEEWLLPYLHQIRKKEDFNKLDLKAILSGMLSWEMNQLMDSLVPENIKVPSGSLVKIQYKFKGEAPVLAVRLQEVFGLMDTPTINQGKTKLLLHLLSPAYRPVQITQDLKSFWQNIYPEVRKELKIKYHRHFWPEDPWTAKAVKGVKKKDS